MKSAPHGPDILVVVTRIAGDGFALRLGLKLFVPFAGFPWFRNASAAEIRNVERPSPDHLHWPALDIDLEVESIRHPEKYPLTFRTG